MDRDDLARALAELAAGIAALRAAERRVVELVAVCRNCGATWQQIAEQHGDGAYRQNVQRKYGPLIEVEHRVVTVRTEQDEQEG
jgi:hypothetical protein